MKKNSFGKDERIRKKRDFQAVYREGKRLRTEKFTIILNRNEEGTRRLGVAVSKKIGNSVTRNRIKRLLREFFRLNKERLPPEQDILISVHGDISSLSYQGLCQEMGSFLNQLTEHK